MGLVTEAIVSQRMKSTVHAFHEIENEALKQIEKAMEHDFVKEIMVFPDVHAGYDIPIGCAVKTEGVVMPSYVGYDIGCTVSMNEYTMAVPQWWETFDLNNLHSRLMDELVVGVGRTNRFYEGWFTRQIAEPFRAMVKSLIPTKDIEHIIQRGSGGIGTLGSGNHFIEVGRVGDETQDPGSLFVTIHSGSRGFGHAVGDYFMKKYPHGIETADRTAYVLYMRSHYLATKFAELNHDALHDVCMKVINPKMKICSLSSQHNFVEQIDTDVFLHRKGCTKFDYPTSDKKEGYALIPGNMLDGVYIVRAGKDAAEWNETCSHGAGRVMSRGTAKKTFGVKQFETLMNNGKVIGNFTKDHIDEHPQAYKEILSVLDRQVRYGIIKPEFTPIKPVINIKG